MRDKPKNVAKEWFFLYERGKDLGREEVVKKFEQLKVENERLLSSIKTHKGDRPRFNMADFNLYKEAGLMEHLEEKRSDV